MKHPRIPILVLCLFLCLPLAAQEPMQFVFRPNAENEGATVSSVAVDSQGDVYVALSYTTPFALDFINGTGLTCQHRAVAVHKITYRGNRLWSAVWCGPSAGASGSIQDIVIAPNGDVLLAGVFNGPWDYDPGAATVLTQASSEGFVMRLSPSGQYRNHVATNRNGTAPDSLCALSNSEVIGGYRFGQGQIGNLTPARYSQIGGLGNHAIARHTTSAGSSWAIGLGSPSGDPAPTAVACTGDGHFYLAAGFRNNAVLDRSANVRVQVTSDDQFGSDAVVARYNANGDLVWHRQFRHQTGFFVDAIEVYNQGIATDANGNVYVALNFFGEADFDPGPGEFRIASLDRRDAVVVSLTPDGDFRWARRIGGQWEYTLRSITVTPYGSVFVGGDIRTSPLNNSAFLFAKLDSFTGEQRLQRSVPIGQVTGQALAQFWGTGMASDSMGNPYFAAWGQHAGFVFGANAGQGIVDIGPYTGSVLTGYDAFGNIRRRNPSTREIRALTNAASFALGASSPGALATLFGDAIGEGPGSSAPSIPLPSTLCGIEIEVIGADQTPRTAPILFCNENQVNFQIPWETPLGFASLQIRGAGRDSQRVEIYLEPSAIGVFFADAAARRAAVQIASGVKAQQLLTAANPVPDGDFLSIYVTGVGALQEAPPATGAANPPQAVPAVVSVTARMNGSPVPVSYVGLSPGFVGLGQVNVQIPPGTAAGQYEMVLEWPGGRSQTFLVWVE